MPFLKKYNKDKKSRLQYFDDIVKRQGLRHAIFNNYSDKYIGQWDNDKKSGKGTFITHNNYKYEGDFSNNKFNGFGILSYELRNKVFILSYVGWWLNGKRHGFGMRKYRNGNVYIGYWRNGLKHYYGHLWYANGDFYAGDFLNDQCNGIGMLVKPNLNRYEGEWKNNMKHGRGKLLHLTTGQLQTGTWCKNICVESEIHDIRFRQSAITPTPYPIRQLELEKEVDSITSND